MTARRALRGERSEQERSDARRAVDEAKRALGERGPVWWSDGAPDYNRKMAVNTPYAAWWGADLRIDGRPDAARVPRDRHLNRPRRRD